MDRQRSARTPSSGAADGLLPLNLPRPVGMELDGAGEPCAVTIGGRRLAVALVQDRWRIDDEWWREPISRCYYRLALANDQPLTVFRDLVTGAWYSQRYG